jgi:AraC-like DNA-binding protein
VIAVLDRSISAARLTRGGRQVQLRLDQRWPSAAALATAFDGVDQKVKQTQEEIDAAAQAQRRAAESSRALVSELKGLGLSGKDMAAVLGISPQRVSQLARPRTGTTAASKIRHRDAPAAKVTRARDAARSQRRSNTSR